MVSEIQRQQFVLFERCLVRQMRDLTDELQDAVEMSDRSESAQARVESELYVEQVFSDIAEVEHSLHDVRRKMKVVSADEPDTRPLP